MKRLMFLCAVLGLVSACNPEENGAEVDNNPKETAVTGSATGITEFSAVLAGYANITPEMGNVTMGILYSTNDNPSLENSIEISSKELDGDNQFTIKATSLSSNTTYYYKAFVQYGGVYRYGVVRSFSTLNVAAKVNTIAPSAIGMFSATLKGSLSVESQSDLEKSVWFLYGQESSIASLKKSGVSVTSSLSADNSFSNQLSDLDYGKTYYYVACAKVHDKELFGSVESFTTANISAGVSTAEASNIGLFSATFNGALSVDNSESLEKSVWFLYSDSASTLEELKSSGIQRMASLEVNNRFSFDQTELKYSTTYYYVACAKVHDKEYYGSVIKFSTSDIDASTETLDASGIGMYKASINGKLMVNNSEDLSKEVWFLFGNNNNLESLKSSGTRIQASLNADGSFSSNLTDLQYATSYFYIACAKVYDRVIYGEVKGFYTTTPYVATQEATNITMSSAYLNGTLYSEKIENQNVSGWFLIGKSNNLETLKSSGTKLSASVIYSHPNYTLYNTQSGLDYATTYYYVACAQIGQQVYYGDIKSFTTSDVEVELTTESATSILCFSATLNGKAIVNNHGSSSTSVWFLCGTSNDLETLKRNGNKLPASISWDCTFSSRQRELNYSTTYYYVACAQIFDKVYYGEVKSFTTPTVSVSTDAPQSVDINSAMFKGTLSDSVQDSFDFSAWFLYGDSNNLETLKSSGIKVDATMDSGGRISYYHSNLNDGTAYYYVACVKVNNAVFYGNVYRFVTKKDSDYGAAIDMGLSVKWRSVNLGQCSSNKYGRYYAWGEIETKARYAYDNYKWYDHTTQLYLKYNSSESKGVVDNKTVLDPEDDVAHVKLGGNWRMPTSEEWKELRDNCTCTWTTRDNVNGLLVKSNINGNTIFLPATGRWEGDSSARKGTYGFYWSSSLDNNYAPSDASIVTVYSSELWRHEGYRGSGCVIRPVTD